MEQDDLEKLFAAMDMPVPDPERRKETLNLATAAFEAQKSVLSKNNAKTGQGSSWLARLISQTTSERKDIMKNSHKKIVYGGLIGGLATACIALLINQGPIGVQTQQEQAMATSIVATSAPIAAARQEAGKTESFAVAEADMSGVATMAAPASPSIASQQMMQKEMEMTGNAAQRSQTTASMPMVAPPMGGMVMSADSYAPVMETQGRDNFDHTDQNEIKQVKAEPVSTFSIDVDTSSYAFVRQSLDQGVLPQKDAVRVEEMVNYFDYAYPGPDSSDAPFKTSVVVKPSPWHDGKKLMTIGIKGYDVQKSAAPDSNLVFLIDTSGSMAEPKKLPLLKQSLSMLLDMLKPTDKISIVTYAGSAGTVLQPTSVSEKGKIIDALQNLGAGGSTAGGEGIRLAYQQAQSNFDKNAVNRVILATDGDFNVGITDEGELQGFIEREREKGIFLSVLGFGTGNYNDALMQKLAQNGNGVAAYIDTLNEARKVLVQEAAATLFPIAKDVKIQVEFNPATVSEYRLVGYETRALKTEDFNNDRVDAGDIGAGAEVTAIYEVTPVGATPSIDESRYAADAKPMAKAKNGELAFVKVRYKLPKDDVSKLITTPVAASDTTTDPVLLRETGWAESVAGFAQMLKGGTYTGKLTYDDILAQANANKGDDPFGYRAEFITLIHKAKTAASMPQQSQGNPDYPYPGVYE